jgi:hypothetical protein
MFTYVWKNFFDPFSDTLVVVVSLSGAKVHMSLFPLAEKPVGIASPLETLL